MSNRTRLAGRRITPSRTGCRLTTAPRASRMTLASFALILLAATLALPIVVTASDVRQGNTVDIGPNETLDENLYVAARDVTFAGQTERNVSIAAATADIGGSIGGSLHLAAGQADLTGSIAGSVYSIGGIVEIAGDIAGDLVVAGGRVWILNGGSIGGDLIVAGGQVDVRGAVAGNIAGTVVNLTVGGPVDGDVDVAASNIQLVSPARIGGDLRYQGVVETDIDNGSVVQGTIERTSAIPGTGTAENGRMFGPLLRALWALIAGAVIIAFAPRAAAAIAHSGRGVLPAVGLGLLLIWTIPILAVVTMVTLVGLPIGIIGLLLLVAILYLSQVFVGLTIGRSILPNRWDDGSRGYNLLGMTLGVLIISALRFIPIPFVSFGISVVVALWGLGAVAMLLLHEEEEEHPAEPATV